MHPPTRSQQADERDGTDLFNVLVLEEELEILQPQLILTLGSVPDAAISRLSRDEHLESASSEYLWRHRLARKWGSAEIFAIPHPADPRGGWHRGHEALLTALRRHQVLGAPRS